MNIGVRSFILLFVTVAGMMLAGCESPTERAFGYLENAEKLFEEGDLVKAEIEVKNTLQILPRYPKARYLAARIAEAKGDFQEMAANLRIAIDADPEFVEARLRLGTLYAMSNFLDSAEEQAQYLRDSGVEDAGLNILNARILAAQGDLEGAREQLETALAKEPDNIQALGLLASVAATTDLNRALELIAQGIAVADDEKPLRVLKIQLLQQAGRSAEVDREYQLLLTEYPDETGFKYQYARFLAEEGRIDEVEPVLRDIARQEPDNVQARLALAQFVGNTQGVEAAEATLLEFIEQSPDVPALRLALARLYQGLGKSDDAYEQYQYIADTMPNEDEGLTAKARMAGILLARGDTEDGQKLLDEVLSIDSYNSDGLLLRGAVKVDQRDFRGAVSDFRTLLRKEPENKQAQMLIARTHASAGDVVLAKDAYRRVLSMDPNDGDAPIELARLLVSEKDLDKAQDVLVERVRVAPGDVRASRVLIAILLNQNEVDKAIAEAERVSELPGQKAVGEYLLGGVYQAQQQHAKAIAAFERALAVAPTAREPLQGKVASLVQLDRADDAITFLKQYSQKYPDNLYAQTLLGQVLAGSGDAVAAERVLQSTLESNESWLPAYTTLAGMQGDNVAAQIDIYERGRSAMPGSQEMALLLGTAYERSGRIDDAIAVYEDVLEVNPNAPAVANNLAALLADYRTDSTSLGRALDLVQQFAESDNPAFVDTLGWVHYRLGNFDEALPLLQEAVAGAGGVPVLRYHLGMAYLAVDKPMSAKKELEAALADPDTQFTGIEDARRALSEL